MARRKAKIKSLRSPKVSTRRYSYSFLTMGGRRFVQLTPERFERLLEKEQENILRTAKYTGEDIRLLTKEDWNTLNEVPNIGGKVYSRLVDIARGTVVAEVSDISITNYAEGLRKAGYITLADRFELYARDLKSRDQAAFELFMENEMPDLYLFYKDKGKSHVKRQRAYNQETADEQIEDIAVLLAEKYKELPDSDRERLERQLYKEENEDSAKR